MKKFLALLLCAAMLAALPAALAEDNFVLAELSEWWGADVTQLDGTSSFQRLIGEPLCTLDEAGNLLPNICSAVTVSEDGKTVTVTIPEGMYFYNGAQLEPEDVIASLQRCKTDSQMNAQYAAITSMEENGRDVIIHLDHVSIDFYDALAGEFNTILDKDEIESKTNEQLYWDCHPYGMYSIKEYISGAQVVLQRNDGFKCFNPYVENKGPAAHETITIRFIGEEFTAAQEFNAGNLKYVSGLSPDSMAQITAEGAVKQTYLSTPNVNYIELKVDDPVVSDYAIRMAIALAIDREELCELYGNVILPAYSHATAKVHNHNAAWAEEYKANFCNDPERAAALLDEAGYLDTDGDGIREKDGEPLILHYVYGETPQDSTVAQGLQVQLLDKIGIYLDLDGQEDNYHYESLEGGKFQVGMSRFGTAECVQLFQWVLCWFPSYDTLTEIGVDSMDAWMEKTYALAQEPDSDKRTEMVGELDRAILSKPLVIPVFTNRVNSATAAGVVGPMAVGDGQTFFNDMK